MDRIVTSAPLSPAQGIPLLTAKVEQNSPLETFGCRIVPPTAIAKIFTGSTHIQDNSLFKR